jgi:ribosomal-protein-alanine N-acetyltransferase
MQSDAPMAASTRSADRSPICQLLTTKHASLLAAFFARLRAAGIEKFFHPHALSPQDAAARAAYSGHDFYCVMLQDDAVIGYGMLRGWDEGYTIPSLGIVIDPSARGRGYGRTLMNFLHDAARQRGATRIRLKVYLQNQTALQLYRSLGYVFQEEEDGQLIGSLALAPAVGPNKERTP